MISAFLRRFWLPPRAHGDVIQSREVSFIELFYDLVFVLVVARAAHHLAGNITWETTWQFVLVLTMVWIAWLNGSLYYDLHGREDGRTRVFIFVEMAMLGLLAVYTGGAAAETSQQFAIVYTLFLILTTLYWADVTRYDDPTYRPLTYRYIAAMLVGTVVVGASIFVPENYRLALWAVYAVAIPVLWLLALMSYRIGTMSSMRSTPSLTERFGLFTIIVLGEVVAGVVNGIADVHEPGALTITTGMVGLTVGFAFWWLYFDLAGRQLPIDSPRALGPWMVAHLPLSLAIAGAGAAIVSLVEHSDDSHTPATTAWLLSGSVAVFMVSLAIIVSRLQRFERDPRGHRPVLAALVLGAALALAVGWWAPAPWLLALLLTLIGLASWFPAAVRWVFLPQSESETAE